MMEFLINDFVIAILVLCLCYILVFVAVCVDLWSGIRKAKKAGIARRSWGFRRTVDKMCRYYNCMLAVSVIDGFLILLLYIFQCKGWLITFPLFPIVTLFIGGYLAFIEACSVFEKLEDKEKSRMSADMTVLLDIIKDEDKFNKIMEVIKEVKHESSN